MYYILYNKLPKILSRKIMVLPIHFASLFTHPYVVLIGPVLSIATTIISMVRVFNIDIERFNINFNRKDVRVHKIIHARTNSLLYVLTEKSST